MMCCSAFPHKSINVILMHHIFVHDHVLPLPAKLPHVQAAKK